MSLKISQMNHSLNMSLPLQNLLTTREQSSSYFVVQVLPLAVRYTHCLQTAWCQLESFEGSHSISKPRCPLYKLWRMFLCFIKELRFRKSTVCFRIDPGHAISVTARILVPLQGGHMTWSVWRKTTFFSEIKCRQIWRTLIYYVQKIIYYRTSVSEILYLICG